MAITLESSYCCWIQTTTKLSGLTQHFIMLTSCVDQESRQDLARMTVLCSLMSGNSTQKTRRLAVTRELDLESSVGSFPYISSSWAGMMWRWGLPMEAPTQGPPLHLGSLTAWQTHAGWNSYMVSPGFQSKYFCVVSGLGVQVFLWIRQKLHCLLWPKLRSHSVLVLHTIMIEICRSPLRLKTRVYH